MSGSAALREAERCAVGALLNFGERIPQARALASPADFAEDPPARVIYRALLALHSSAEWTGPANVAAVLAELEHAGDLATAGGRQGEDGARQGVADLMFAVTGAAHVSHHLGLIAAAAAQRRQVAALADLLNRARDGETIGAGDLAAAAVEPEWERADGPMVRAFSAVEPQELKPLWPERIYLGKTTILAGDPGRGKSSLTCDLAARVSIGMAWPDGARGGGPGDVLMISAEDTPEDVVVHRLIAAGADLARVHVMDGVRAGGRERPVGSLDDDLAAIGTALAALPRPMLLVVDPLSAFLGKRDGYRNSDMCAMLHPLGLQDLVWVAGERSSPPRWK